MVSQKIFIAGSTGYIGRRLIPLLVRRGHEVRALVRKGSEGKVPANCTPVSGDALDANSFADKIAPATTFVQLIGVAHPSPSKAEYFRTVDLVSIRASVSAAVAAQIEHFIYVSVAHPAPIMRAYIEVRREGESLLRSSGIAATVLRPWYVLGPGHWWPCLLSPVYWVCERLPATRASASRLGLVTLGQMLIALVCAAEERPQKLRVLEVPEIRRASFN